MVYRLELRDIAVPGSARHFRTETAEELRAPASNGMAPSAMTGGTDDAPGGLLGVLWRCRYWIASIVSLAGIAAALFLSLSPPQYTAVATIEPDLRPRSALTSGAGGPSTDATAVVESQMRSMREPQLMVELVERIVDQLKQTGRAVSTFPHIFGEEPRLATDLSQADIDSAANRLAKSMTIETDPRTYLISVAYTAADPKLAAHIVNLLAAQYLHRVRFQSVVSLHATALATLEDVKTVYGPKHPTRIRAQSELDKARQRMTAHQREPLLTAAELIETGQVTPARAISVPSGPRASGVLIVALLAAFALCVIGIHLLERAALRTLLLRYLDPGLPNRLT